MSAPLDPFAIPTDDVLVPFQVEGADVRGRLVRLGPVVDEILTAHAYPEPVARLLGEALVLVAMMGAALKTDGSLILQTRGEGPVPMLVADYRVPGELRGYADLTGPVPADMPARGALGALLGKGHMAITLDPGGEMRRYQGLVALEGDSLSDCALDYFRHSEQIATLIHTSVATTLTRDTGGTARPAWRAGGIMIQHLAAEGGLTDETEAEARAEARQGTHRLTSAGEDVEEAWRRAQILMATLEEHELHDPELAPAALLFRLYAEDGVRLFEPSPLTRGCRCSPKRVRSIIGSYEREEMADMIEDGVIKVTCAFCNVTFQVDPAELAGA